MRSGGHHVAGTAVCNKGLMIDLSDMVKVSVDTVRRIAVVEAGATLGDVDTETQKYGLATPTGTVSETGVAGLAL
ncbi:FAD-binding protein [Paenibacillus luteus]|uniref:FAD-binding protein n=1 Tax=Paenibacillus luteus TaxID=2545753 RepID=UPI0019D65353|nr:FAD-binding protein [Paenibacillus luteus]